MNRLQKFLSAAALGASLNGCATHELYLTLETEPPGAHVYVTGENGTHDMGQTPIYKKPFDRRVSQFWKYIAFPINVVVAGPEEKDELRERSYSVYVSKNGYFPIEHRFSRNFQLGTVDEENPERLEFNLTPIPRYSFTVETDPEGASIEHLEPIKVNGVPTGKYDFLLVGETPYTFSDYMDEDGNGLGTFRLKKPGFMEKTLNIKLGEPAPQIQLERE